MKIHIYSNCWNEMRMLPYYFRHYSPIADRFIIFDDGSTDGSVEYLRQQPKVEVKSLKGEGSFIERSRELWNNCWKESRGEADWVINCNIDEHLYHRDLLAYLKKCQRDGSTILTANGYQMVSDDFPEDEGRLCDTLVLGRLSRLMSKTIVFDPNAILEINYTAGRHRAQPKGRLVFPEKTELKLLHYKFLGIKYVEQRYFEMKNRLSGDDIMKKRGYQYLLDSCAIEEEFNMDKTNAVIATDPNFIRYLLSIICLLSFKISTLFYSFTSRIINKTGKKRDKTGRTEAI